MVLLLLCGISFVENNSFMDIGPLNYILVCCLTLTQNPGKFMFNETM